MCGTSWQVGCRNLPKPGGQNHKCSARSRRGPLTAAPTDLHTRRGEQNMTRANKGGVSEGPHRNCWRSSTDGAAGPGVGLLSTLCISICTQTPTCVRDAHTQQSPLPHSTWMQRPVHCPRSAGATTTRHAGTHRCGRTTILSPERQCTHMTAAPRCPAAALRTCSRTFSASSAARRRSRSSCSVHTASPIRGPQGPIRGTPPPPAAAPHAVAG